MSYNVKLPKIVSMYAVCFGYIWVNNAIKGNNIQSAGLYVYILDNTMQLLFYMAITILNYLIAKDKPNKILDLVLLFIPAVIFIASRFIVTIPNIIVGNILRNLMLYSNIYSFVGVSILCGLFLGNVGRKQKI